jgi:L-fucose mutarotase
VLPLDSFIDHPLERMEVEDDPVKTTSLQNELLALASESEGRSLEYGVIPRLDFYQRASAAYAVVHTLEDQPYGCFILHKGVIF